MSTIFQANNKLIIDSVEVNLPKNIKGNNVTTINDKVYINGFEYNKETKTFKRSFLALWHYFF